VAAILDHLASQPDLAGLPRVDPVEVEDPMLELAHTRKHVADVRGLAEAGGGWFDADTYCRAGSYGAALRSVGAAVACADAVVDGRAVHAFAIVRPPGHHTGPERPMGFCLFNNAAIAVRHAQRRGMERVAVIDIDVHHGNGTEEVFWDDPTVLYTSLHQRPLYPGTGPASARGGPAALDLTLNVPVPPGTTGEEWLERFDAMVVPAVTGFRPDLVLVSAGYDGHVADPLASLRLTAGTYASVATRIAGLCAGAGIGSVWLLEGGYDLVALGESVAATLRSLLAESGP
jgi:acetoin utilization deacetylase AcuC-like enzyme